MNVCVHLKTNERNSKFFLQFLCKTHIVKKEKKPDGMLLIIKFRKNYQILCIFFRLIDGN